MGLFWNNKKKFGLAEALVVVDKKPDITSDGAKTGAAFVEALGLPVTVVSETEKKIEELEVSLAGMQDGVKVAKTELVTIPTIAGDAIDTLKTELKKLVKAIQDAVLDKVGAIEDAGVAKARILEEKIEAVKNKVKTKWNKTRTRGEKKTSKITKKIDNKITEVEAQLKGDLANLKDRITDLEAETKSTKVEIGTLTKIKTLFA